MTRNRLADGVVLLTFATASCLALTFIPSIDEGVRGLFGLVGFVGVLVFVVTGSSLQIHARGGLSRTTRLAVLALVVCVIAFLLLALPVALSPKAGQIGFNPNAALLTSFSLLFLLILRGMSIVSGLICLEAIGGWIDYLSREKKTSTPRNRNIMLWWTIGLATVLYFAFGCFVVAPPYAIPLFVKMIAVGLLVGLAFANDAHVRRPSAPSVSHQ